MSIFNFIKSRSIIAITLSVVMSFAFVAIAVNGATTISTNISTGGTLSVTGLSTLSGGATTTTLTLLNGEIISNATDGVIQLGGIASTTSITLLNGETITNATDGTITLGATNMVLVGTASTSAIKVGDGASPSTINGLVFGYCTVASIAVTASTSAYVNCTGATGVVSGDRVFIQATSSLPARVYVQSASSTATAGTIQLRLFNTGIDAGDVGAAVESFNFWAVR